MNTKLSAFIRKYYIESSLIVILILGISLRFYALTVQSYWVDELFTLFSADPSDTFEETIIRIFNDLVHPPVYNVMLWIWFKIFGFSEYAGRSFSAFIGTLSIIAIYYLGKEIFNKNVGIYAALLTSINYFLIYYSQEARSYSLLFLLAILSYLFLFKAIRTQSKSNIFLYILFTILVIYTHYFGFFLAGSQLFVFLFYVLISPVNRKKLITLGLIAMMIISLTTIPLLYYILSNSNEIASERMGWCPVPTADFFITYFMAYFSNRYLSIVFAILLLFLAIKMYFHKIKNNKVIYALIIWVFISYLLPYMKSIVSDPLLTPRYTIVILPAILLLISIAIDSIKNIKLKYVILALIIISSLGHLFRQQYYTKPIKEEWRKVAKYVISDSGNYPIYTPDTKFMHTQHFNTYFKILGSEKIALPIAQLSSELDSAQAPSRFWIVNGHSKNLLPVALINKYTLRKVKEVKGLKTIGVLYEQ